MIDREQAAVDPRGEVPSGIEIARAMTGDRREGQDRPIADEKDEHGEADRRRSDVELSS